jgi:hypothetical protein
MKLLRDSLWKMLNAVDFGGSSHYKFDYNEGESHLIQQIGVPASS